MKRDVCDRDCADRSITCHAKCEKYLAYVRECERQREERKKRVIVNGYTCDMIDKKMHEIRRKTKHKIGGKSNS